MGALRQLFVCREGRELLSLRLDGELSELEEARLDAHLAACPDCRTYEAQVIGATRLLRSAELEPVTRPIVLPQRRRLQLRSLQVGAAAAVVAVAAVLGTLVGPLRSHQPSSSLAIVLAPRGDDHSDQRAQKQVRRLQMVPSSRVAPQPRRGGAQPA